MKPIKKIYISLISLVLTIIIFGTATYAWISVATINNIDGLSITASTGNELQISIDGISFSNRLPTVELEEIFEDIKLYDVTSMDGMNFYTGGLREFGIANPGEHYLSFDLWFRTVREEHGIYLVNNVSQLVDYDSDMNGTYVVSRGISWRNDHAFFNGPSLDDFVQPYTVKTYYASEAVRISVVELVNDLNPLDQRQPDELRAFIYDPSENPYRGFAAGFGAYSYFLAKTGKYLELPTEMPNTSYRLTASSPFDPYQALDNDSLVAMLQPTDEVDNLGRTYYKAKVRINIWVEGWDADAFDALHRDLVKIQLQFKALNLAVENLD